MEELNPLSIRSRQIRVCPIPPGTWLNIPQKKLTLRTKARLSRLRKNSCFVSGHDFTACGESAASKGNCPSAAKSRIHCKAFAYGLKAVPFRENEFFRKLFSRAVND